MAVSLAGNVAYVSATSTLSLRRIDSIKYIGISTGTCVITDQDTGLKLWEESGTSNSFNNGVRIHTGTGIVVTLTNGATVYLYTKDT